MINGYCLTASLFAYSVVKKPHSEQMRLILDSHRPLMNYIQGKLPLPDARRVMYKHISLRWGAADLFAAKSRASG